LIYLEIATRRKNFGVIRVPARDGPPGGTV
jgi:hypothetical protein